MTETPSTSGRKRAIGIVLIVAAVLTLGSCAKEDRINPVDPSPSPVEHYALLDYQDTLHLAYAMRTDLYDCNNIVLQLKEGGRLTLLSSTHLGATLDYDTASLSEEELPDAQPEKVVVLLTNRLHPNGIFITRGKLSLTRTGNLYMIQILGATENGVGFRCKYTGRVHDLTAASNQGNLCLNDHVIDFRLGIVEQEGDSHTYRLIGSNPDIECTINSAVDLAGRTISLSSNPAEIAGGQAAGLTASFPGGAHVSAHSGTLRCSSYDNIYSLILSGATEQGEIVGTFTGPIFTAY